jgi:hypothetical protein
LESAISMEKYAILRPEMSKDEGTGRLWEVRLMI